MKILTFISDKGYSIAVKAEDVKAVLEDSIKGCTIEVETWGITGPVVRKYKSEEIYEDVVGRWEAL